MHIHIEKLDRKISERDVEIVERKCSGHPDTICDSICEAFSRELSKAYLKKFGKIMHHNVDKALLVAGSSAPKFGGGKMTSKIKIIISGRAAAGVEINKIGFEAAKDYIQKIGVPFGYFDIELQVREGAANLQKVFSSEEIVANDTSFGVGYAPYSKLENYVLEVGALVESGSFAKSFPFVGRDIKIMGLRANNEINLTIAAAFIDRHVKNIEDYFAKKSLLLKFLQKKFPGVNFAINTLDDEGKGEAGVYLTVSGLSAEMGDDGEVGRGNRVNGMITPNRPMTLEAACGKNPVTHTGKIYSVAANIIAFELQRKLGLEEVNVKILSSIGKPISQPQVVTIEAAGELSEKTKQKIAAIAEHWLSNLGKVTELILKEKVKLC